MTAIGHKRTLIEPLKRFNLIPELMLPCSKHWPTTL